MQNTQTKSAQTASGNSSWLQYIIYILILLSVVAIILGLVFGLRNQDSPSTDPTPSPSQTPPTPLNPPSTSQTCQKCADFINTEIQKCVDDSSPYICFQNVKTKISENEDCNSCTTFTMCLQKKIEDCKTTSKTPRDFAICVKTATQTCL